MDGESLAPVLGVDIGGTFTDFVLLENGRLTVLKRLTTPADPSEALLAGVADLSLSTEAEIVHGSTIATNALLERRGARTALITTEGFADVLAIARQDRPDLYALVPQNPETLVPADWRLEVVERVTPQGVLIPLDEVSVDRALDTVEQAGIESVAVCLLFSFLHPAHEQRIRERVQQRFGDHVSLSLSSDILPEYREFERTSTSVINAYVTPLMDRYLGRVEAGLAGRRLMVMQSNGGVITAEKARNEAARTALSGPAGGVVGAFHVARQAGMNHIISFDMGGTSTDVALCPGDVIYTREATIGEMPLRLPIVDVHTVGAGGGSIARVDAGGALQVGPESAGADPGPACYGQGGNLPTASDANALLGRLHPDFFLGGQMALHLDRARDVLARLAADLHVDSAEEAAWGVLRVANASMERAVRAVSVERGYDPRDFTLVAFGGAGPLHACALAEALRIPRILIPRIPGVLSALGMAVADRVRDISQPVFEVADTLDAERLAKLLETLGNRVQVQIERDGSTGRIHLERELDMRYSGQSHAVTVSEPDSGDWLEGFHTAHARRFGHRHDEEPVEIVTARVRAVVRSAQPALERVPAGSGSSATAHLGMGEVWFSANQPQSTPLYQRADLRWRDVIDGPAVIFQVDSTTVIGPGWTAVVDEWGNLVLSL